MGVSLHKKSGGLKYFILITIFPILGIIIIFSYAFFHVLQDVRFISNEIKGMDTIKHIESVVFDIQKMRGLTSIKNPNNDSQKNIQILKKHILNELHILKLSPLFRDAKSDFSKELFDYTDFLQKSIKEFKKTDYEYLSKSIVDLMVFSKMISYHCNLILDPDLNSYIMIDNMVNILPELIEYNGRIRATSTAIEDDKLTEKQKQMIIIQLHNIQESLEKLNYNINMLQTETPNNQMATIHAEVIKAQNTIVNFTREILLGNTNITVNPETIYKLTTDNINKIIELYNVNIDILDNYLKTRLYKNKKLSLLIILTGLASIMFIVYINKLFYNKNREFIEKIEMMTITDPMTSLYNRRHFDREFDKYVKTQQRTKQVLAFIILDIDFFKEYNDTYGHDAGDKAIILVAKILKESLKRANDMAFRLGGEEFGILFTEPNKKRALDFAQNIRKKIEDEKIEHEKNSASKYLTISMGLFVIDSNYTNTTKEIYRFADKALYKAKEKGRNNIVCYDDKEFL